MHNAGMVLDGIDVFVKVVEAGSFSGAARLLGMPTTTVSAKIARLEERLGVTLIRRTTRRMHVTDAGRAYYQHCVEALLALGAGEEQLLAGSREPSGVLRMTAASDAMQMVLAPMVARYLAAYPKAAVELVITSRTLDLLAEGLDLAMRASPMPDSTLHSRKVGTGRLGLFATPEYLARRGTPRTPVELASHEVIAHSRFPASLMELSSAAGSFSLTPSARLKVDDLQALRTLALESLGIALLPRFPGFDAEGLVPVLPDYGSTTGNIYFVYPASRFVPVNVRAFIDVAMQTMTPLG